MTQSPTTISIDHILEQDAESILRVAGRRGKKGG